MIDNKKDRIDQAKKNFRNHKAKFKQFDGISTLDWRNIDGSSNYYVRYVFDEDKGCLYITGDLGSAVVRLTEKALEVAKEIAEVMCYQSYDHGQSWRVTDISIIKQEERYAVGVIVRVEFRIRDSW